MRRGDAICCPRATSGQAVAEPTIPLMKSRRRIAFTKAGTTLNRTQLQQGFGTDEIGFLGQAAQQQRADTGLCERHGLFTTARSAACPQFEVNDS